MLNILNYIKVVYLFHVLSLFIFLFQAMWNRQELSIYLNIVKYKKKVKCRKTPSFEKKEKWPKDNLSLS